MAILLDDPQTQSIIKANNTYNNDSELNITYEFSNDTDSERFEILPNPIEFYNY